MTGHRGKGEGGEKGRTGERERESWEQKRTEERISVTLHQAENDWLSAPSRRWSQVGLMPPKDGPTTDSSSDLEDESDGEPS